MFIKREEGFFIISSFVHGMIHSFHAHSVLSMIPCSVNVTATKTQYPCPLGRACSSGGSANESTLKILWHKIRNQDSGDWMEIALN